MIHNQFLLVLLICNDCFYSFAIVFLILRRGKYRQQMIWSVYVITHNSIDTKVITYELIVTQ